MPDTQPNSRCIRVFISSTFRDMMGERDELMTHVWPELRQFCRERQVELVEVDLRWGVTEAQSTRKETLKLCLDEIRACRPYFIGILGERYGWTPPADVFTPDLKEEQPWVGKLKGRSVTEMEILHGVLNNPEMAGRAFFYFRHPAYAQSRGADFHSETPADAQKQTELKAVIRKTCRSAGIPLRENYPDPRGLAPLVLADLKKAIHDAFPLELATDMLKRDAGAHEAFAKTHRRAYVDPQGHYAILDSHVAGSGSPLILQGGIGSGKSALLANWIEHWQGLHPRDFIFQHYIGGSANSFSPHRLMLRLTAEIKRWTEDPTPLPRSIGELRANLPVCLAAAQLHALRLGVRFVVVLDSLDQIESEEGVRFLKTLPDNSFLGSLRLVASTLPGEIPQLAERRNWQILRLQTLSVAERHQMITRYLKFFGKRLDEPIAQRLAEASATGFPLYLKIILDELRVTGTFGNLEQRIAEYLGAADVPALLRLVLKRWQRDYERDRVGLVGDALSLIWAARRGLTETELLQLLRPVGLPQLPCPVWSPLRCAMAEGMADRGGVLTFGNRYLRAAVESLFIKEPTALAGLRMRLADYFEELPPDARICDELPWMLHQVGARHRLKNCLLDVKCFLCLFDRDEAELMRYWVWLGEERGMGALYLRSLEQISTLGQEGNHLTDALLAFGAFFMHAGLVREAEEVLRKLMGGEAQRGEPPSLEHVTALEYLGVLFCGSGRGREAESLLRDALRHRIQRQGPHHPDTIRTTINMAGVLAQFGQLSQAEELLRLALKSVIHHFGEEHVQTSIILSNLAQILQDMDQPAEAERLTRRALEIARRISGDQHPNVVIYLNNLAQILRSLHRTEEALPLMEQALSLDEQLFGSQNPRVAIRLNNLAVAEAELGKFATAEARLRSALLIDEQAYGTDHPMLERRCQALGHFLMERQRQTEAEPYLRRALCFAEIRSGANHPSLIEFLKPLARALTLMGHERDADQHMERAARILLSDMENEDEQWRSVCHATAEWARQMRQAGHSATEIISALKHKLLANQQGKRGQTCFASVAPQTHNHASAVQLQQAADQALALRQWEQALVLFGQLQSHYEKAGDRRNLLSCLLSQAGILAERLGRYKKSLGLTEQSFLLAREIAPELANDLWKLIIRLKAIQKT